MRARELRIEAHIESRVEIDRVWAATQQAVQIGAAIARAGSCWLERSVREVVRGEVERLEREHLDVVVVGCSAATRRTGWSEGHATDGGEGVRGEASRGRRGSVGEGRSAVSRGGGTGGGTWPIVTAQGEGGGAQRAQSVHASPDLRDLSTTPRNRFLQPKQLQREWHTV